MTKVEYDAKVGEINAEHKRKVDNLQKRYAESNNPVQVGDIITDHYHTIKVKSWTVVLSGYQRKYPCLVYTGVQYTKTGNVAKRQIETSMLQENIKYINGKTMEDKR